VQNRSGDCSKDATVITHAPGDRDLTLSFVLCWLIVAAAARVVLAAVAA
jgi:hypothetical protein